MDSTNISRKNILIWPATEACLEIYNALKYCKEVCVHVASQDFNNHAAFLLPKERFHILPSVLDEESNWLESLISLCKKENIEYIFPAYDDILLDLSMKSEEIFAECKAVVIAPDQKACKILRSKKATYEFLQNEIRVPKVYKLSEIDEFDFPLFLKPDKGQGSKGATIVNSFQELDRAIIQAASDIVLCEYLPNAEYTVDCFSDSYGLCFCKARKRNRIRNGIAVNTSTKDVPEAEEIGIKIEEAFRRADMPLRGAWFFQVKRSAGDCKLALLEVAPRISGSMACHRVQGVNFPLLSIYEREGMPVSLMPQNYQVILDRALSNKYRLTLSFDQVFVDLDDTLIIRGQVNLLLVSFLFQCINQKKHITLLTRNEGDIKKYLEGFRLWNIFDAVIRVEKNESKCKYIPMSNRYDKGVGAILIDDSFRERKEANNNGIVSLDVSMVECLLNATN